MSIVRKQKKKRHRTGDDLQTIADEFLSSEQGQRSRLLSMVPEDVLNAKIDKMKKAGFELTSDKLESWAKRWLEKNNKILCDTGMAFLAGMFGQKFDKRAGGIVLKSSKSNLGGHAPLIPKSGKTRRTKRQMQSLADDLVSLVEGIKPATVRQVFYQATVIGLVPKTENEGYKPIQKLLVKLRRQGRIPYSWITDATRWMRKPKSDSSLAGALDRTAEVYRRDFWARQETYVEIWIEKDALAGVVLPITAKWDVPLMVARGFSSLSYLHSAGEAIKAADKKTFIYHLGDFDPSGVCASRTIERELRSFAPGVEINFQRLAVTEQQIEELQLPTRPTKKTDSRAGSFGKVSVELDAIPPHQLRKLVDDAISQHVDQDELERLRRVEAAERETLRKLSAIMELGMEHVDEFTSGFSYPWQNKSEDD